MGTRYAARQDNCLLLSTTGAVTSAHRVKSPPANNEGTPDYWWAKNTTWQNEGAGKVAAKAISMTVDGDGNYTVWLGFKNPVSYLLSHYSGSGVAPTLSGTVSWRYYHGTKTEWTTFTPKSYAGGNQSTNFLTANNPSNEAYLWKTDVGNGAICPIPQKWQPFDLVHDGQAMGVAYWIRISIETPLTAGTTSDKHEVHTFRDLRALVSRVDMWDDGGDGDTIECRIEDVFSLSGGNVIFRMATKPGGKSAKQIHAEFPSGLDFSKNKTLYLLAKRNGTNGVGKIVGNVTYRYEKFL
jgi:hypothetical protein